MKRKIKSNVRIKETFTLQSPVLIRRRAKKLAFLPNFLLTILVISHLTHIPSLKKKKKNAQ